MMFENENFIVRLNLPDWGYSYCPTLGGIVNAWFAELPFTLSPSHFIPFVAFATFYH